MLRLQLKKESLVELSDNKEEIPQDVTPHIGGGGHREDDYIDSRGDCSIGCSIYSCTSISNPFRRI